MHELTPHELSVLYRKAHDSMRNIDGLQPQEAFDELLKFLFFKQTNEEIGPKIDINPVSSANGGFEINPDVGNEIRLLFSEYIIRFNSWFENLWKDKELHLSNTALMTLYSLFSNVHFVDVPFDTRSAALKEFLSPEIRKGLGIFLTPDDVVKMMIQFINPSQNDVVYDPACGSGTFLIETIKRRHISKQNSFYQDVVWGTDKNPRMLILAELNIGHFPGIVFNRRLLDALYPDLNNLYSWPKPNSFDIIFTNPPFGVILDNISNDLSNFQTCRTEGGGIVSRQTSEIIFIEQCLRYLKPGGRLAIVLPRSVATNNSFAHAREELSRLGYIYSIVTLPPETFASTGTQSTTLVLFIKKFGINEDREQKIPIGFAKVSNVGFDSTGRPRIGNQLATLSDEIERCISTNQDIGICKVITGVSKSSTFSYLPSILEGETVKSPGLMLEDVTQLISIGRTPSRNNYSDDGLFLVKVGNLTGNGISWIARERNYVNGNEATKRLRNKTLILQEGDILLTASAHNPVYIAKKVDIVHSIPAWVGSRASFVAEVMIIRSRKDIIDPYILLVYLRSRVANELIRGFIKGQTAHLYPSVMRNLPVPQILLEPDQELRRIAELLKTEANINVQINDIAYQQQFHIDNYRFSN